MENKDGVVTIEPLTKSKTFVNGMVLYSAFASCCCSSCDYARVRDDADIADLPFQRDRDLAFSFSVFVLHACACVCVCISSAGMHNAKVTW